MNTTFHVYDDHNYPVGDLINLDEERLIKKIKERVRLCMSSAHCVIILHFLHIFLVRVVKGDLILEGIPPHYLQLKY